MTKKNKFKKGDILLLLLYVDNCSPIRGRTRLQKMVFVFEKEIYKKYGFHKTLEENLDFKPYNFGPFSKKVFELMEFFVNVEMVNVKYDENNIEEAIDSIVDEDIALDDLSKAMLDLENESMPLGEPEYCITQSGKEFTENKLIPFLNEDQHSALTKLKMSFNRYSLSKILKYVYMNYPEMAENSTIRERVLENTWEF